MASPTWWTWVWVDSRSWWWTGRPGVLRFMGSQRVRHDLATKLNWTEYSNCGLPSAGSAHSVWQMPLCVNSKFEISHSTLKFYPGNCKFGNCRFSAEVLSVGPADSWSCRFFVPGVALCITECLVAMHPKGEDIVFSTVTIKMSPQITKCLMGWKTAPVLNQILPDV